MKWPTLILLGFGRRRRAWIALPVVFLWPLWAVAWVIWLLFASARLSGLALRLSTHDGHRIHVRMM